MRALAMALATVLASCATTSIAAPTPPPTPEPGTLSVTALLDLSGARAAIGTPQRDGLTLWTDQPPIATPKVKLKIVDVASSDAKTIIELRRAVVDDRAQAILVGTPIAYDETLGQAVALAAMPVLFTQPIPDPTGSPGGAWAFALAPTPAQLAFVAAERPTAGALRLLPYATSTAEVSRLPDPTAVAWPGSRTLLASSGPRGQLVRTFTDRFGVPPTFALSAYDAITLLAAAALGGTEAPRLRDGLDQTSSAGWATTYAFTPSRHAGFSLDDLVLLGWDGRRMMLR